MSISNVPPSILCFECSLEKTIVPKLRQGAGRRKIASSPTAMVSIVNDGGGSEPDQWWWVIPKGVVSVVTS